MGQGTWKGESVMRYYLGGKPLTRFDEALEKLMDAAKPIERKEKVALTDCGYRVLAEDIIAPFDVPPFDRAAMDGYAVRAEDITRASPENPVTLKVVGQVLAGDEPPNAEVTDGTCFEVATGAPIPKGSNCVVPVEDTQRQGDSVLVLKAYPKHANIDERGADIRAGETVLREGTLLTPARIGVLAGLGLENVSVYARPKVAIIPTGSEIAKPGEPLRLGQVYDMNTYTLASLLRQHGCEPWLKEIVPDDEKLLRDALEDAIKSADTVVFTAGSSIGQRDRLPRLVGERGTLLFHGLATRPGRPTLAAVVDGKLVVNLPGFPTSCLMMAYVLLVPVLRKLSRLPEWEPQTVQAKLAHDVKSPEGLRQFLTVRLRNGWAEKAYKESSTITSLSHADGFIVIPEEVTYLPAGITVTVTLL
ncbi:molybdopterin molybdotransferase MoeA [Fervidibacter sacchari]